MPIRQRFDRLLLAAAVLQMALGLALLASASWVVASERYGRPDSYFVTWQAATAMVGLGLLVICMHLRTELLTDPRLARFGVALSWVLLGVAFMMPPVANTYRWFSIGGISVQPSVLVRLSLIMLMAILLDEARRNEFTVANVRTFTLLMVCLLDWFGYGFRWGIRIRCNHYRRR